MSRNYARLQFSDFTLTKASLQTVDPSNTLQLDKEIALHNISMKGLCFSTNQPFEINDQFFLQLRLFSPRNYIVGQVIWKKKTAVAYTYGISILATDFDYHQYMKFYDNYRKTQQ
ncbi:PilZ domain-containing protein [Paraliobacillus ryukyuensis]|uniref:PilZ domain-containing protein n=1 Tax=Paraliobacillus ryukyuensis TaxID=200904 RepID=UPI0015C46CA0|nr:PilZ domain-containing protein [Paraliobacillus ryukyuensis]